MIILNLFCLFLIIACGPKGKKINDNTKELEKNISKLEPTDQEIINRTKSVNIGKIKNIQTFNEENINNLTKEEAQQLWYKLNAFDFSSMKNVLDLKLKYLFRKIFYKKESNDDELFYIKSSKDLNLDKLTQEEARKIWDEIKKNKVFYPFENKEFFQKIYKKSQKVKELKGKQSITKIKSLIRKNSRIQNKTKSKKLGIVNTKDKDLNTKPNLNKDPKLIPNKDEKFENNQIKNILKKPFIKWENKDLVLWLKTLKIKENAKNNLINFLQQNNLNGDDLWEIPLLEDAIEIEGIEIDNESLKLVIDELSKLSKNIIGLNNMRNTCYLNSAIQCILQTPLVSQLIFNSYGYKLGYENMLTSFWEFSRLAHQPDSDKKSASPNKVYKELLQKDSYFDKGNQEDASLALQRILIELNENYNLLYSYEDEQKDTILNSYKIDIVNITKCLKCDKVLRLEEHDIILSIPSQPVFYQVTVNINDKKFSFNIIDNFQIKYLKSLILELIKKNYPNLIEEFSNSNQQNVNINAISIEYELNNAYIEIPNDKYFEELINKNTIIKFSNNDKNKTLSVKMNIIEHNNSIKDLDEGLKLRFKEFFKKKECNCKNDINIVKKEHKVKYSDVIILKLDRFMQNHTKNNDLIEYPEVKKYGTKIYELFGVIIHSGSTNDGGHYYAYVKSLANSKWYKANDSNIEEVDVAQAVNNKQASVLLYRLKNSIKNKND